MSKRTGDLRIGTSGWHYEHWRGPFYPEDLREDDLLPFCAERFSALEVNNTFYQLPDEQKLATWRDATPDGFTFAVKAHRYSTHSKKLKDPEEHVHNTLNALKPLGRALGTVLFQLPGGWKPNAERLATFLDALPRGRYAVEFRDERWHVEEIYEALREHGVAFVVYDLAGEQLPRKVTAGHAYVRLHGPSKDSYHGSYGDAALDDWARTVSRWTSDGVDVELYFDNDHGGNAPRDALRLLERL